MDWLIDDVKRSIKTIYGITFKLVRSTRFACVAYRDTRPVEGYITRSLPLTNDLTELQDFLNKLEAAGGGDMEEAVQEGLKSVSRLKFRKRAYKVVVFFADAPAHDQHRKVCFKWVKKFHQNGGFFHSVLTSKAKEVQEKTKTFLDDMAQYGGGTMVYISKEGMVLRNILSLVFGSGNKSDVDQAIKEYQSERRK